LKVWIEVEEQIDIAGMDVSRVESGLQFSTITIRGTATPTWAL